MALQQLDCSVQNDGNFSQLDLRDVHFGGPLMRIETFRCSQPADEYGVTAAGTSVVSLAGRDHLSADCNRVFRHVFSVGQESTSTQITLEIRESFQEDGSCEIRCRDLDPQSETFGNVLIASVAPFGDGSYVLHYAMREIPAGYAPRSFTSPLRFGIADNDGLPDIGSALETLGAESWHSSSHFMWTVGASETQHQLRDVVARWSDRRLETWRRNIQVYERFGDFRDKCIHPGTNLCGVAALASEYVILRAYRQSLILLGAVADPEMTAGLTSKIEGLSHDPKPGVYAPFLAAYHAGIRVYQLGLDKVHSDYGGIPMRRAPGSRLETGAKPLIDAERLNRTLAELAFALFCEPSAMVQTLARAQRIK